MGLFSKRKKPYESLQETVGMCWERTKNAKKFLKHMQNFLELMPEPEEYGDKISRVCFQMEAIAQALLLVDIKDKKEERKVFAERIIELGEEIKNI